MTTKRTLNPDEQIALVDAVLGWRKAEEESWRQRHIVREIALPDYQETEEEAERDTSECFGRRFSISIALWRLYSAAEEQEDWMVAWALATFAPAEADHMIDYDRRHVYDTPRRTDFEQVGKWAALGSNAWRQYKRQRGDER